MSTRVPLSPLPLFTLYDPQTQQPLASVQAENLPAAYVRLHIVERLYSEPPEDADDASSPFHFAGIPLDELHTYIVGPQDPSQPINWPVFLDNWFYRLPASPAKSAKPP